MELSKQTDTDQNAKMEDAGLISSKLVFLLALLLGIAFDLLFYGKMPGISLLIFVLLILFSLQYLRRIEGVRPVRSNVWLLAPLLFFAAMVAVRANPFLRNEN